MSLRLSNPVGTFSSTHTAISFPRFTGAHEITQTIGTVANQLVATMNGQKALKGFFSSQNINRNLAGIKLAANKSFLKITGSSLRPLAAVLITPESIPTHDTNYGKCTSGQALAVNLGSHAVLPLAGAIAGAALGGVLAGIYFKNGQGILIGADTGAFIGGALGSGIALMEGAFAHGEIFGNIGYYYACGTKAFWQ
jgi:hypothetical protein